MAIRFRIRSNPLAASARKIRRAVSWRPLLAIELGSGFAEVAAALEVERAWDFSELPGFPITGVSGHPGRLLLGHWLGVPVVVLSGRTHYYEGFELEETTFPIRVVAELGVDTLLLTNAAGAIRRGFRPGDFMGAVDHLNFIGANPLRGPVSAHRPRFVDLIGAYDPALLRLLRGAAKKVGARYHEGVYLAVSGPSYETPAEIRAFRGWGADAVGMSTVPGAIVARQCGLRVAALSCLTNLAAGLASAGQGIDHERDVLAPARSRAKLMTSFVEEFIRRWEGERGLARAAEAAATRWPPGSGRRRASDSK